MTDHIVVVLHDRGHHVRVAEPLRQMLRTSRRREWTALAADYLARPSAWWGVDAPRHADKLERAKQAIRARDGLDRGDVIATTLGVAARRRAHRPRPVYVTGLGASGSHWLTSMLTDTTDLVDAGEVYVPRTLLDELAAMSQVDQACVIDAVTVLHAWARSRDAWALGTVNCAAGVRMVPRARRWFPDAIMVHLRRDPRDQVLSVAFRKPRLRAYLAPDATDDQYLGRMIRRNVTAYREFRAAIDHIDVDCSYEALLRNPRPVLREIVAALGHDVDDDRLHDAIARHDAATIRSGGGTGAATNLDEGGRARSWRELDDPARRRQLHVGLMDVICGLGYEPGDCLGSHVPDPALPARTFSFDRRPPGPLFGRVDGAWRRLDTRGTVTVGRGVPVMLRLGTDDARDLRVLRARGADDVQALCLAGNPNVDDDALRNVAALRGLQTLDLGATGVTDAGLAALAPLVRLQQVNLASTPTTPRGRARLASDLPQATIWT